MSCYICGRGSCCPSFHSIDEQEAYSDAEDAYQRFLDVRERCRDEYLAHDEEDES